MKIKKFIWRLLAHDWIRYLLAMACLIGVVILTTQLIHDIRALMGW